ncbi:MAG: hypothetical protein JJ992_01125, partial [Planctomycetes bacterium]|nr:hypothetical protein [Planctomycetota bacterium]
AAGLDGKVTLVPVHVTVGMIGLVVSAMYFVGAFCINTLAREFSSTPVFHVTSLGGIILLAGLGLLLIGALWEVRRSYALPSLYVWGVIVIAFALDSFRLPVRTAFFAVGMAAAAYVMLTGLVWRQGALLASMANNCGICEPVRSLKRTAGWLPMVNLLIGAASMLATLT